MAKTTELTELTSPLVTDILPIVSDPGGTPVTKKVTLQNVIALIAQNQLINSNSLFSQALNNGNFDLWSEATSFAGATVAKSTGPDCWGIYSPNTAVTFSQQAAGLNGSRYSLRAQRNNASANTNKLFVHQTLESADSIPLRGQKITLSFYGKCGANFSAASSILRCEIITGTGTDENVITGFTGAADAYDGNKTLTTTLQKFTCTLPSVLADSVNQLSFVFSYTPTGTAGVNDWFEITRVKVNIGDVDLPHRPRSKSEEAVRCARFLQIFGGNAYTPLGSGKCDTTTLAQITIPLLTKMRATPTVTYSGNFSVTAANGGLVDVTLADNQVSNTGLLVAATAASGLVAGNGTNLFTRNSTAAYIAVRAAL